MNYVISDVDHLFALCSKFVRREILHDGDDNNKYLRLLGVRLARLVFENEKACSQCVYSCYLNYFFSLLHYISPG